MSSSTALSSHARWPIALGAGFALVLAGLTGVALVRSEEKQGAPADHLVQYAANGQMSNAVPSRDALKRLEAAIGFAPRVPTHSPGDEPLTLVLVEGSAVSDTSRNQSVLHYASPAAGGGLPARQMNISEGRSAGFARDDCKSSEVGSPAIPITKCESPSGRADIYRFEVGDHLFAWTVIPGAEFATEEMVEIIEDFARQ